LFSQGGDQQRHKMVFFNYFQKKNRK